MARYDGLADWYADYVSGEASALTERVGQALGRLLGQGTGRCLDIGCGGGAHIGRLASLGWSVVGVDASADQIRVARDRVGDIAEDLLVADAGDLPFSDGSFDAAVSVFTHTDFGDLGSAMAQARRVLRSGARFVYAGTHPCFVNPFTERDGERRIIHPRYRREGWADAGPGIGTGVRRRAGTYHVPLSTLLRQMLAAGFLLRALEEPGDDDPPLLLAVVLEAP